jgi:aminoglycoside phosphotransferase (APT) family kinase protein
LRTFDQSPEVDPRPWVDELTRAGCLSAAQAGGLVGILDRLASTALAPVRTRLCHGDVNAANIMVAAETLRYRAVIDWAGAGWLDPAWDLVSIPLPAVRHVLEGHRRVAPFEIDETAEARALWCHARFALYRLRQQLPHVTRYLRDDAAGLIAKVEAFLPRIG